jgi:hypothetical protein
MLPGTDNLRNKDISISSLSYQCRVIHKLKLDIRKSHALGRKKNATD